MTTLTHITPLRRAGLEFAGLTSLNVLLLALLLVAGRGAGLGPVAAVLMAHGLCALVAYPLCRFGVWLTPRGTFAAEIRRAGIFFAGAAAAACAAMVATATINAHGSLGLVLLNYAAVGVVSIAKFGVQRSAMLAVEPT
jgi:hypothetical protein